MGKRSDFKRNPRDFYPTPESAVLPLIPHLGNIPFVEPCAGDGALIEILFNNGWTYCQYASDIKPLKEGINGHCYSDLKELDCMGSQIVTNPPWDRKILHPMIEHFRQLAPTWLLFDADWMHTKQSHEYMKYCKKIISVGRVKWIPDSKMTGKDNCAWYLFDKDKVNKTHFYGR